MAERERVSLCSTLCRQDIVFIDEFREKRTKHWQQSQCLVRSVDEEGEPSFPTKPPASASKKMQSSSTKDNYSAIVQARIIISQEQFSTHAVSETVKLNK